MDFIVVGAGTAGCVVAARLSEDPGCRVLLLEAGTTTGTEPEARTPGNAFQLLAGPTSWGDLTTPQDALGGRRIGLAQGRGIGGASSMNMMAWFHGRRQDYDIWQALGATGWGWDDVQPVLRAIEDNDRGADAWHGVGGPMAITSVRDAGPMPLTFVAAGVEYGLPLLDDFNGPADEGVGLIQSNIRDGRRHSVVDGYLTPAWDRHNLVVAAGRHVTSVIAENGRAVGVRVGDAEIHAHGGVVLCAGALRTPQLLMLSGIGPADHLGDHGIRVVRDLPDVGANLQDHPMATPVWPVTDGSPLWNTLTEYDLRDYRLLRRGPLASLTQAAALLRSDPGCATTDIQFTLTLLGMTAGMTLIEDPVVTCAVSLLDPDSRGTVRLASANPADPPLADPKYLDKDADRARLRAGLRRARDLFRTTTLAKATGGEALSPHDWSDQALDAWIDGNVGSEWHPVGSCRMGTDAGAVVDPATMGVRGLDALFVADASVMPAITRGNTQAPTIMIAERATPLITRAAT
ncbi:GMC family oxidoreductase N-terminal domain-containing protein [Streptosporangium sp. NPDC051023]|uniref:GMC family oxidoreductase n=1 Tax=Streptosporangium sp. NPDC051023 TaxID=3155410 RepID=UPI00344C7CA6